MSMKYLLLRSLFLIPTILNQSCNFFAKKEETFFKPIELEINNTVINNTPKKYMDTVVNLGLNQLEIVDATVVINYLSTSPVKEIQGGIEIEAYITPVSSNSNIFFLYIKDNIQREEAITVLSHEMVHVKQYVTQQLFINEEGSLLWEGETMYDPNSLEYFNRPWERDAFHDQAEISNQIKNKLY